MRTCTLCPLRAMRSSPAIWCSAQLVYQTRQTTLMSPKVIRQAMLPRLPPPGQHTKMMDLRKRRIFMTSSSSSSISILLGDACSLTSTCFFWNGFTICISSQCEQILLNIFFEQVGCRTFRISSWMFNGEYLIIGWVVQNSFGFRLSSSIRNPYAPEYYKAEWEISAKLIFFSSTWTSGRRQGEKSRERSMPQSSRMRTVSSRMRRVQVALSVARERILRTSMRMEGGIWDREILFNMQGNQRKLAMLHVKKQYEIIQKCQSDLRISVGLVEENMFRWRVCFQGPPNTPFEGGLFEAELHFPDDFPYLPPKMLFKTEMFHPNIYPNGEVCISILHPPVEDPLNPMERVSEKWNPVLTMEAVLISVISMLVDPNIDSPANVDAAKMFRDARKDYDKKTRYLARKSIGDV